MTTQHTPGPWENLGTIVQAAGLISIDILPASAPDRPVTHAEIEANARLIAAAPELLMALKELVGRHDRPHGFPDEHWYGPLAQQRTAIAQAEGK